MKELIYLHIGQAGVQIGDQCWEQLKQEHKISSNGELSSPNPSENIETLFYEANNNKQVPRCVMLDLDPSTIDEICKGKNRQLFHADSLISGKEDAADNFARGCYTVGREMQSICQDRIRKLVEGCDSFEGFVYFNSIGGGTGSGFSSKLYDNLKKTYEKSFQIGLTVYPSPQIFTSILEPFNALLAIGEFLEFSTAQFCFDNEALYQICENQLDVEFPNYANINQIISQIQSIYTAPMRFNNTTSFSFTEMINNLISLPKMQFLFSSYAPFQKPFEIQQKQSLNELSSQVLKPSNNMASYNLQKGKNIACQQIYFNDNLEEEEEEEGVRKFKEKDIQQFQTKDNFPIGINWEQPNISEFCNLSQAQKSLCMCTNSTIARKLFQKIIAKFEKMYTRKAYTWWYVSEGMEEGQFRDAQESIESLLNNYEEMEIN